MRSTIVSLGAAALLGALAGCYDDSSGDGESIRYSEAGGGRGYVADDDDGSSSDADVDDSDASTDVGDADDNGGMVDPYSPGGTKDDPGEVALHDPDDESAFHMSPYVLDDGAVVSTAPIEEVIARWPKVSQNAARAMFVKYGPPDVRSDLMLVWENSGPFKRTIVTAEAVPHAFPRPHFDVLEQVIDHAVPVDKFDDLAAFDGSVMAERTKGELSARCDYEEANFLALNLAHDVITGRRSVGDARRFYAKAVESAARSGATPYMKRLLFNVKGYQGDLDVAVLPPTSSGKPRPVDLPDLIAVDARIQGAQGKMLARLRQGPSGVEGTAGDPDDQDREDSNDDSDDGSDDGAGVGGPMLPGY